MQLDKGRILVLAIAVTSIAVWLIVFPMVLTRGPAGAYSGEEGGVLCVVGGEEYVDRDIVRFVRRFHYLGVRSEVRTGADDQLCFAVTLARRVPEVAQAVLRKGRLQVFEVSANQSALFEESAALAAGLQRSDGQGGPEWVAESESAVQKLIMSRRDKLPGPAYTYCRGGRCTAVVTESEPVFDTSLVMAVFPINAEEGKPALLMRLAPPALQALTARVQGPVPAAPLAFVVDGRVVSVQAVSAPQADGQVTVSLDPAQEGVEFEAAILSAILSSGTLEGDWRSSELRLNASPNAP